MLERWPHQQQTFEKRLSTDVFFDMSDPGTGKTRSTIDAFVEQSQRRALVLAPKTLLETAWATDITKFAPELRVSVAYAQNREQAFSTPADVYITNIDAVKWIAKQGKRFFDSFDTLIVDESSCYKHHTSQRSKAAKKIKDYFKYRTMMTGTPTSRSITDIWHQTLLLDDGERFGTSFYKFRSTVCQPVMENPAIPQAVKWVDKPNAKDVVYYALRDISIRHRFDEVMKDVPENQEYFVYFKPNAKLKAYYDKLRDECLLMASEGTVSAVNRAVLRGKLLQLAAGSVYGESGIVVLDKQRSELVCDLVEQRKYSIVFFNWRHQKQQLEALLKGRKIPFATLDGDTPNRERLRIVERYQAGEYQTLLMHPQTGAHGLTLTRGTSVIWVSPTDHAELMVQGKHRILRGGQTETTECIKVCARNTLEKSVYDRTDSKRESMTEFLELLRGG